MKRAALVLAFLASACAATPTPTRDELAHALGESAPAAPTDITHIACETAKADEVACQWRQRDGRHWQGWQSHLAHSSDGWQLIDAPQRRP